MAVASDPTKYCPACYRKEIGRLSNHKSNTPRWVMSTTIMLKQRTEQQTEQSEQQTEQQTDHHIHIEDVD